MPQTATVQSTSIKEGTNDKGPWTNTLITTTDGAKLGTFEKGCATLKAGAEFEYEPEIKGDRVNIKKGTFKLLKQGTDNGGGSADTMSKGDWQTKDETQRRSIERQVSAKLALEFTEGSLEDKLQAAAKIYEWVSRPVAPTPDDKAEKPTSEAVAPGNSKSTLVQMNNVGVLLKAVGKTLDDIKPMLEKRWNVSTPEMLTKPQADELLKVLELRKSQLAQEKEKAPETVGDLPF